MKVHEESTTTITFTQGAFAEVDEVVARIREEAYEAIHGQTESRHKSLHRIFGLCCEIESKLHQGVIGNE